jgi:hypothetical protein
VIIVDICRLNSCSRLLIIVDGYIVEIIVDIRLIGQIVIVEIIVIIRLISNNS